MGITPLDTAYGPTCKTNETPVSQNVNSQHATSQQVTQNMWEPLIADKPEMLPRCFVHQPLSFESSFCIASISRIFLRSEKMVIPQWCGWLM